MRILRYILLGVLLLALGGCSPYAKQMRQTKKFSKQNVQRQENKKADEIVPGAEGLSRDDVNYKDLDAIRHRCIHVNKKGKRCGRKVARNGKYCRWHVPRHKI